MGDKYTCEELAQWSGGDWAGPVAGVRFGGISNDTRTIEIGFIYIALQGENHDGHRFVEEAFDKGASAVIVDSGWFGSGKGRRLSESGRLVLVVEGTRRALGDMARGYRMKAGPVITGVTGSAGKTTVKEMTALVMSEKFTTAHTKGNWNNDIGLPLSLLSMEVGTEMGVFEAGTNHPGELAGLCDIMRADCGIVTNVGPAHIEFFESVEAIAREKAALLESLPEDGTAILCKDDVFYEMLAKRTNCGLITVSLDGDADYRCMGRSEAGDVEVEEKASGERMSFRAQLPGSHNVINALMAIAAGRRYGIGWSEIRAALEKFKPLPMRWERKSAGGIHIINDAYNANPASMRAAIRAFEEEKTGGEKWLVLAGMKELGECARQEHISLGEFVGEGQWKGVVVVGDFGAMIALGAESAGFEKQRIYRCVNNDDAAKVLNEHAKGGDTVLLKASRGMKLEEIISGLN